MILTTILIIITALLIFWRFIFLRDPKRKIPQGRVITSPADGKIIEIRKVKGVVKGKKGLGIIETLASDVAKECYLVAIFMNPINVHVNRAPIKGKVLKTKHSRGKFFRASSPKAMYNEKNEILIKGDLKVKMVQIAGLVARRIECWVKEGQEVMAGERVGRINLGSQVMLIMPSSIDLKVRKNQKVKAGTTIIATY
jgi:phosphatidylserine decarboxylase